jgi:beta-glucosidase
VKELKAFKKVMIKKGENTTVTFNLSASDLAFYHNDLEFYAEPGEFMVFVGGNSNASLSGKFDLK